MAILELWGCGAGALKGEGTLATLCVWDGALNSCPTTMTCDKSWGSRLQRPF